MYHHFYKVVSLVLPVIVLALSEDLNIITVYTLT